MYIKYTMITILILLSLINISSAQNAQITQSERKSAEESVKSELRDPESARFSWQKVFPATKPGERKSACATVNAKNGFGGYTGPRIFWAVFEGGKVHKIIWMPEFVGSSCGQ